MMKPGDIHTSRNKTLEKMHDNSNEGEEIPVSCMEGLTCVHWGQHSGRANLCSLATA